MITIQEVYDKVASHLLTQGCVSERTGEDGSEECAYRGDAGRMCAVGCLIESKHYSKKLEGKTAVSADVIHALEESGIPLSCNSDMQKMLRGIQEVHDSVDPCNWKERLQWVAEKYTLSSAVLEGF